MSIKLIEGKEVANQKFIDVHHHCKVINRKKYDILTSELLICEYIDSDSEFVKLIML